MRGKFSVLLINDIDAGLGHFENTQTTVNNQIVVGTLMNLCDNPNSVRFGHSCVPLPSHVRQHLCWPVACCLSSLRHSSHTNEHTSHL